jgi:hypothetical protein
MPSVSDLGAGPGAATVHEVSNSTHTGAAAHLLQQALCGESWFAESPTVTNATQTLRRLRRQDAAVRAAIRVEQASVPVGVDDPMRVVAENALVQVGHLDRDLLRVDDLNAAVEWLYRVSRRDCAKLLTEPTLRTFLDMVPGGAELLKQDQAIWKLYGKLRRDDRFGPDAIGMPALRPFLRERGGYTPDPDLLEAANRVLLYPEPYVDALLCALDWNIGNDPELRHAIAAVRGRLGSAGNTGPLLVPRRPDTQRIVAEWTNEVARGDMRRHGEMLTRALDASGSHSRAVAEVVLAEIVELTPLPYASGDKAENFQRLCALFGRTTEERVLRRDVEAYPALWAAVRGASRAGRPAGSGSKTPPGRFTTWAEVRSWVVDYVEASGNTPRQSDLTVDELAELEAVIGMSLGAFVDNLAAAYGWKNTRRSENEQRAEVLVREAFSNQFHRFEQEYTDPTWDRAFRFDLRADVTVDGKVYELYVEADGQGHYQEMRHIDLDEYRQRDREKSANLKAAVDAGRDVIQVNIHHRLLTGSKVDERLLQPQDLRNVVTRAVHDGRWWVNLTPPDSDDERAVDGRPTTLGIVGPALVLAM